MNKLTKAAKLMGSIGGKKGTGKAKRRSKEHYIKMVKARMNKLRAETTQE